LRSVRFSTLFGLLVLLLLLLLMLLLEVDSFVLFL